MKNVLMCTMFALLAGVFSLMCIFKTPSEYSESERRLLAQKPSFDAENVLSGKYMSEFENYAADQVPFREELKTIKAHFVLDVLRQKENNSLFFCEGHISKKDGEINYDMIDYATGRFEYIYDRYLTESRGRVYLAVIPDKNFYIAEENGYPSMDYEKFINAVKERLPYMQYTDITKLLTKDDYYKTDTHWKSENTVHIAKYLADKMGVDVSAQYEVRSTGVPFYGVYAMQSAVKVEPDEIKYLTNETLKNCTVTYIDGETGKKGEIYDMKKLNGKDPYEMFLSGSVPICVIENDNASSEKELILFRDSFGSSIAPLFAEGYKKITVIDIRYVDSEYLDEFVDFTGQDVLFLYSTTLLNNSLGIK